MIARGDVIPPVVTIEQINNNRCIVRITQNVEQYENGYVYDEYIMPSVYYPRIAEDIEANIERYVEQAIFIEEEKSKATEDFMLEFLSEHEERICMLELFGEV